MPKVAVIDISHYQLIESFEEAKAEGVVGVIHKLTEGLTYVDRKVKARYHLAQEASMAWGVYHFLRPGNMKAQAQHFVTQADKMDMGSDTMFAADHEDKDVSLNDLVEFLRTVQLLTGRSPVIYSGHVLKEQLRLKADARLKPYRLWLAQYSSKAILPPGFDKYWIWQYTDKGEMPGIQPPVDLNACWKDDTEALLADWGGAPEPLPEDTEEADVTISVTMTIESKNQEPMTLSFTVPLKKNEAGEFERVDT